MVDYKERAKKKIEEYHEKYDVKEEFKFYIEQLILLQEEFKSIPNDKTIRRKDIMGMILTLQKEVYRFNIKEKNSDKLLNMNILVLVPNSRSIKSRIDRIINVCGKGEILKTEESKTQYTIYFTDGRVIDVRAKTGDEFSKEIRQCYSDNIFYMD